MHRVSLPGTTIETTVLGFGCNGLLGPRTRQEGLRLLETAFDAGIRHFDVARGYGFGDAEGLVGEFAYTHPGEVTITTKFGLSPDARLAKMRGLVTLARRLMRVSPLVRQVIKSQTKNFIQTGNFTLDVARSSLETSLQELNVGRIDMYLLHECRAEDCGPELLDFLRESVSSGQIGQFGIGTEFNNTLDVCRLRPEFASVVQLKSNIIERNLERIGRLPDRTTITHGAFTGSAKFIRMLLINNREATRRWSRAIGANCRDPAVLSGLLLAHAVDSNPDGIVLFSSSKPETIRANARIIAESTYSRDQVSTFAGLVEKEVLTASNV